MGNTQQHLEFPVLVVGGGPVGLAMAIDLDHNGVGCLLIEQGDGRISNPKIGTIMSRSMEFFRRWGIDDRVRKSGFPDDYRLSIVFCTSLTGYILDRDDYPSTADTPAPDGSPYKRQRCPQNWLDPLLMSVVAERPGIDMRLHHRLDGFTQDENGVSAEITALETGQILRVRADYLIGCDGANSKARRALNIDMAGNPRINYSIGVLFHCPDLVACTDTGEIERAIFVGPEGTWGNLTVIDGSATWRLTVYGKDSYIDLGSFDAGAWIERALGTSDIAYEIRAVVPWRRTELVAERYRDRSVILAGDACHTMSPTGGMGVNTGFGDVFDLGWKIAAIQNGWGGERLLDAYEAERRPIALRNAAFSTHNFKTWQTPEDSSNINADGPEAETLRRRIGAKLKHNTKSDWQSWGIQLGYRYDPSPICIADGTAATDDDFSDYVQTARPGHRAPHAWLDDGRSTLDLFGGGFVLLALSGHVSDDGARFQQAASQLGIPLRVVSIEDSAISALYAAPLVLVRPDGHVAWRGTGPADWAAILQIVAGQTAPDTGRQPDHRSSTQQARQG